MYFLCMLQNFSTKTFRYPYGKKSVCKIFEINIFLCEKCSSCILVRSCQCDKCLLMLYRSLTLTSMVIILKVKYQKLSSSEPLKLALPFSKFFVWFHVTLEKFDLDFMLTFPRSNENRKLLCKKFHVGHFFFLNYLYLKQFFFQLWW